MGVHRHGMHGMLAALLALPLAACEAEGEEPWHGVDDGAPLLVDDPGEAFVERARLFDEAGEARLTVDGPALASGTYTLPPMELVVVDAGEQVRIFWDDHTVELLLWLDRGQLDDVVAFPVEGTALHPGGDGFVGFPAGASATSLDEAEGRSLLTARVGGFELEAWVPLDAVDQVWETPWEPAEPSSVDELWVSGPVADAPGGEALAWPVDGRVAVEADGEPVDGWVPVRWADDGWSLQGWVYEDDVAELGLLGGTFGCGGCFGSTRCGFGMWPEPNVPAGSWLRAEPHGPIVGKTVRALHRTFADGWAEVVTQTPWGEAVLYVEELR